jgi:hypothetical protein
MHFMSLPYAHIAFPYPIFFYFITNIIWCSVEALKLLVRQIIIVIIIIIIIVIVINNNNVAFISTTLITYSYV